MDLKNVIAAIALSTCVIVLYGLFFAPQPEQLSKNLENTNQKEIIQNPEAPSIEEKVEVKSVSHVF